MELQVHLANFGSRNVLQEVLVVAVRIEMSLHVTKQRRCYHPLNL